jgi:hypothetical protein
MKTLLSAVLLIASGTVAAECTMPQSPTLPDGATSEMQDMVDGQKSVKAYVAATEGEGGYLDCLTKEGDEAADEEDVDADVARVEKYNAAVGDMEKVATAFNEEIRKFKAKGQ